MGQNKLDRFVFGKIFRNCVVFATTDVNYTNVASYGSSLCG